MLSLNVTNCSIKFEISAFPFFSLQVSCTCNVQQLCVGEVTLTFVYLYLPVDGKELSQDEIDVMMSTLTRRQASVVKKRVDSISATMRKRHKHTKTDVRDIFANMPAEVWKCYSSSVWISLMSINKEQNKNSHRQNV